MMGNAMADIVNHKTAWTVFLSDLSDLFWAYFNAEYAFHIVIPLVTGCIALLDRANLQPK